jgi:hypothetical protein
MGSTILAALTAHHTPTPISFNGTSGNNMVFSAYQSTVVSPLTPNDLQRSRAVSPLKLKSPVKIWVKNQQIHQLLIQFINYVW